MLEVGHEYENAFGAKVKIVAGPSTGSLFFQDEVGICYRRDGRMLSPAGEDVRLDLREPR